jgi:gliding motility-associated protein GldM
MALPKEPRQKMINLMYLVLTALLALNVSNEILNAFKVVDNSLLSSNVVINGANTTITDGLAEQAKKEELQAKVAIWKPRAEAAIAKANEMSAMIDGIKKKLKTASDLKMIEGKEVYKEDDLDAPTRFFIKEGEGKKLQAALQKYLTDLQAIVPKEDQRTPLPNLPIDVSVPATQNAANKTWEDAYFHMTPSVAAITILSKFQNDVLRSGNLVANYCQEQVGKVVVILDKFEILTSQSSSYLLPGQPLEIKAGIGAFSSNAKPTISINGVSQQANDSGFARYTTTASGSGGNIPVSVSFTDPNTGTLIKKNTTVSYTVGQPSGASIFLEKMNVMYLGVDNPLTISTGTGKAENARVSFSGGSITGSGSKWVAKPDKEGPATVTITVDGKSYPFPIRCKILPDPVALVGEKSGGRMKAAEFRVMGGVRAKLKDSDFDALFVITSYTIAGNGAGFPGYTPVAVNGATWGNGNAVITQCKPGSTVYIDDIKARGPDGRTRPLPPIAFQLQ